MCLIVALCHCNAHPRTTQTSAAQPLQYGGVPRKRCCRLHAVHGIGALGLGTLPQRPNAIRCHRNFSALSAVTIAVPVVQARHEQRRCHQDLPWCVSLVLFTADCFVVSNFMGFDCFVVSIFMCFDCFVVSIVMGFDCLIVSFFYGFSQVTLVFKETVKYQRTFLNLLPIVNYLDICILTHHCA